MNMSRGESLAGGSYMLRPIGILFFHEAHNDNCRKISEKEKERKSHNRRRRKACGVNFEVVYIAIGMFCPLTLPCYEALACSC